MGIRWVRVVLGALLLEIVLIVTLAPLSFISQTAVIAAVPIAAFGWGLVVSAWILRKVPSALLLHAVLIGVVATAMYFALVAATPGGFAGAVAMYGVPLFWFCQVMRIAGCAAGGAHLELRRRIASVQRHQVSA